MNPHVSPAMLETYRTSSVQLDDQSVSSVEDHVMSCDVCRSRLGRSTPVGEIDRSWAAIVGELESNGENFAARPQRFWRPLMLAAASVALIALVVVALAARREPPAPASSTLPAGFVDLGSIDDLEPGEVRWVEQHQLFLVRSETGHLVLSQRSPTRGCRLATGDELDPDIATDIGMDGNGATFADPCHGATFALDGTRLTGPATRGMYRYRFEILDDRIVADTRLLVPGRSSDPTAVDVVPQWPGPGIVDSVAQAWLDAAGSAVAPVFDGNAGPYLWPLGAFHDTSTDVVTVYMTVGGDPLQLQVGTIETLDTFAERDPQGSEVLRAHPICGDAWADTPASVVSCQELVGYLNVVAAVDDPTQVVAELYAPDGGDRVVMLTLDSTNSDSGMTAANVLLHIVEAFDEQP